MTTPLTHDTEQTSVNDVLVYEPQNEWATDDVKQQLYKLIDETVGLYSEGVHYVPVEDIKKEIGEL